MIKIKPYQAKHNLKNSKSGSFYNFIRTPIRGSKMTPSYIFTTTFCLMGNSDLFFTFFVNPPKKCSMSTPPLTRNPGSVPNSRPTNFHQIKANSNAWEIKMFKCVSFKQNNSSVHDFVKRVRDYCYKSRLVFRLPVE